MVPCRNPSQPNQDRGTHPARIPASPLDQGRAEPSCRLSRSGSPIQSLAHRGPLNRSQTRPHTRLPAARKGAWRLQCLAAASAASDKSSMRSRAKPPMQDCRPERAKFESMQTDSTCPKVAVMLVNIPYKLWEIFQQFLFLLGLFFLLHAKDAMPICERIRIFPL